MTSLRTRLIVGSSLVAIVPLLIAMMLLSRRIEGTVREQAGQRLSGALGGLQARLDSDAAEIQQKLAILGNDPELKRLYVLHPRGSRELSEELAQRRFLLGLDQLRITDTAGVMVSGDERLESDSSLVLTLRAPIRYQGETVGMLEGGRVFDRALLQGLETTSGVHLLLDDGSGRPVASTLESAPTLTRPASGAVARVEGRDGSFFARTITHAFGPERTTRITGLVPTAESDRTLAGLRLTSALLGALGLGLAVLLGVLWSGQVSRPVERLAAYSNRLAQGHWDEPLALHSVRELETLVTALDRMRGDLKVSQERLVTSERHAAFSHMARQVAHEIKNPLTPIAISVADLRRSYELKRPEFPQILEQAVTTVGQEIETMKRMLQEFSDFGRFPAPHFEPCRLSALLNDIATLHGRDVTAARLIVAAPPRDLTWSADAGQLRQALVNLVKNGLEAAGDEGKVEVSSAIADATLEITVSNDGPGLSHEQTAQLFVPGFTTKATGSGLGLTIVERIVNDHHGTIAVDSGPDRGTRFKIRLPLERRS